MKTEKLKYSRNILWTQTNTGATVTWTGKLIKYIPECIVGNFIYKLLELEKWYDWQEEHTFRSYNIQFHQWLVHELGFTVFTNNSLSLQPYHLLDAKGRNFLSLFLFVLADFQCFFLSFFTHTIHYFHHFPLISLPHSVYILQSHHFSYLSYLFPYIYVFHSL